MTAAWVMVGVVLALVAVGVGHLWVDRRSDTASLNRDVVSVLYGYVAVLAASLLVAAVVLPLSLLLAAAFVSCGWFVVAVSLGRQLRVRRVRDEGDDE